MTLVTSLKPAPLGQRIIDLDTTDLMAIKSVGGGTATPEQQALCLKVIYEKLCGVFEQPFDPDNQRLTDFGAGRQYVGHLLQGILQSQFIFKEEDPGA